MLRPLLGLSTLAREAAQHSLFLLSPPVPCVGRSDRAKPMEQSALADCVNPRATTRPAGVLLDRLDPVAARVPLKCHGLGDDWRSGGAPNVVPSLRPRPSVRSDLPFRQTRAASEDIRHATGQRFHGIPLMELVCIAALFLPVVVWSQVEKATRWRWGADPDRIEARDGIIQLPLPIIQPDNTDSPKTQPPG